MCNATDTAHKMLFFPSHKVQCQGGKIILCWMVWCFHEKIIWQSCQQFSFLQIKKCREICTIYVKKCKCMYFTDDLIWNSIFLKSNTVGKNFEKSAIKGRCLQFCLKEKKIRFFFLKMILVEIIIQPLIYENFLKIAIYVVLILPFQKNSWKHT